MNNKQLQAMRQLLFLTTNEAAEYIGGCTQRTWQRWEKSDVSVPNDVAEKVQHLICERAAKVEALEELLLDAGEHDAYINYHTTFEDYEQKHQGATVLDWKMSQSIAAEFYANDFADLG